MKILILLGVLFMGINAEADLEKNFYEFKVDGIDGKPVSLSQYKGKVALVVNTASKCGFTPQYKDLEALYEKYKGKGLVVLGFPSNDFGQQEPGSNAEIKKFCELKYAVSFPLFSKIQVLPKKDGQAPLYKYLTSTATPSGDVQWNFEKFLIDKNGKIQARYLSKKTPTDPEVEKKIESLL